MDLEKHHPMLLPKSSYHPVYKYVVKPIVIVAFPLVLIVRICIVIPILALSALFDFLLNLGTDETEPLPKWRRKLFKFEKNVLYRAAMFVLGWILLVEGETSNEAKAIVANHCSMLDILAFTASGLECCIAKAAIASNPFFGPTLKVTRSILARRGKGTEQISERFSHNGWPPVGVFPAGTTTYQGALLKMRTGIFHARPRIQVASIKYYSLENPFYITGALRHVFGVCAGLFGVVKVTYYPLVLEAQNNEPVEEYAERVAGVLAAKSGAVETPYTYKDALWFDQCGGFTEEDLSEEYTRDQLWRGNIKQWTKLCLSHGKDPLYAWTKNDLKV